MDHVEHAHGPREQRPTTITLFGHPMCVMWSTDPTAGASFFAVVGGLELRGSRHYVIVQPSLHTVTHYALHLGESCSAFSTLSLQDCADQISATAVARLEHARDYNLAAIKHAEKGILLAEAEIAKILALNSSVDL